MQATRSLLKTASSLFSDSVRREAFVEAIVNPTKFPPTIFWLKEKLPEIFTEEARLSWQPSFVDRLNNTERPGANDLHEQGYYYCLDFSSIFALAPLSVINQPLRTVIDVCSSPGGKGIYAWRLFRPSSIIFNEVIAKRHGALFSNIKRCRVENYQVTRQDVSILSENYAESADLVLVDAPCSGQSLRARGQDSFGCFDGRIIKMNAKRQRRILAHCARLVKAGGYLLYTTCTYSREENEENLIWFQENNRNFIPLEVNNLSEFQSGYIEHPCYRIWPQSGLGAGAFSVLMQKGD
ncbi:MAG: RsmB/NOP family class I SAM-dependent RNA methyltransferase [Deltaproteobacteria bacterium]|nr:RsmB/NOP family class I SAM-dependent RNA methyltransferase [Deltaproteobacteria bacterium]